MDIHAAQEIVEATPLLANVDRVEHLREGYSHDEKFVLWERDHPRYLLRFSDISFLERRRNDFALMRSHWERGTPCSRPYLFGTAKGADACYTLLSYIAGRNVEVALPELPEATQFEIGVEAGRELRKMHEMPHPNAGFDWAAHRRAKYERQVANAREMRLSFARQDEVERYVEANLPLLDRVPVRFQHDDFHPANLIIDDGRLAGIIDFNRCDWGDPIEDFYKVPWFTVQASIPFARGQVMGYLVGGEPEAFWARYNLYVAMTLHGNLTWTLQEQPHRMVEWQARIQEIIDTHDFSTNGPPGWWGQG